MEQIVQNKKYFVAPVNSSKANKFTCYYHYSHVGFKKAKLNLGIYDINTKKLVGVQQWGCSAQEGIRLDRYVKEPITTKEYYELNRFCMADTEGKNAESQAIALGIKWIKRYQPQIRLLVSYAGRKEGNYGYIYQASNWEYLGYFVSNGFWRLDGQEVHHMTVWYRYSHSPYTDLSIPDALCKMYNSVIRTWTKQFIYIQRLDSTLTVASPILSYPKPSMFSITDREKVYKDEPFEVQNNTQMTAPEYHYDSEELLFTREKLIRDGVLTAHCNQYQVAMYDLYGQLLDVRNGLSSFEPEYLSTSIRRSALKGATYKDHFFKLFPINETDIPEEVEVPIVGIINEIPFISYAEIGRYCGVTRQAAHAAWKRHAKTVHGYEVIWIENT